MVRLENIKVVFSPGTPDEKTALNNINLKINTGDFITVIGSNGAGKTTLFNALSGTYKPTSGKVILFDSGTGQRDGREKDITGMSEYKRARFIGRIFQNPLLGTAGNMSLEDNMTMARVKGNKGLRFSLSHATREKFRLLVKELDMGLEERLKDNVQLFSGGQRQALTLLMTVMSKPDLVLLDEHTAALDPRNAEIVMALTKRFWKEYGLTVMMVTHNMKQALEYGNRLLMMDGGEIILDIGAEEKAKLTTDEIVRRFRDIKHKELDSDEMLLG
jgi:putative ABC transport system ATP-binding protein